MPAVDTEIVEARRKRLKAWIAARFDGRRKDFVAEAEARGHKIDPSEISNLQSGNKSFGEKKALMLEEQAAMPAGYLVQPLDPATDLHVVREETGSKAASQSGSHVAILDDGKLTAAIAFVRQLESSFEHDFLPDSVSLVVAAAYKYLQLTQKPNTVEMAVVFGKMLEKEDERLRAATRSR